MTPNEEEMLDRINGYRNQLDKERELRIEMARELDSLREQNSELRKSVMDTLAHVVDGSPPASL